MGSDQSSPREEATPDAGWLTPREAEDRIQEALRRIGWLVLTVRRGNAIGALRKHHANSELLQMTEDLAASTGRDRKMTAIVRRARDLVNVSIWASNVTQIADVSPEDRDAVAQRIYNNGNSYTWNMNPHLRPPREMTYTVDGLQHRLRALAERLGSALVAALHGWPTGLRGLYTSLHDLWRDARHIRQKTEFQHRAGDVEVICWQVNTLLCRLETGQGLSNFFQEKTNRLDGEAMGFKG